jgi:hypothetical protein
MAARPNRRQERPPVSELHPIGYTEDAEHLVLDDRADGAGRHLLAVEPASPSAERLGAASPLTRRRR